MYAVTERNAIYKLDFKLNWNKRGERESRSMSVIVTPFSCPLFIPQLRPAVLRPTPQYEPDPLKSRCCIILAVPQIYNIPSLQKWNVRFACSVYIFLASDWDVGVGVGGWKEKLRVWWMCSGHRSVGGPYLSALLLQKTAKLQAYKPHYHHRHQQQIPLQPLSAVHNTTLTAQTCTYPECSALECPALKSIWLCHCS